MPGGAAPVSYGTNNVNRVEAPVTIPAYLTCVFAAFGGILFGYDSGYMCVHLPLLSHLCALLTTRPQ
jgi:hypothetical protein